MALVARYGEEGTVALTAAVRSKLNKLIAQGRGAMDERQRAEHDRFLLGGEAKENRKKVRRTRTDPRLVSACIQEPFSFGWG